MAINVDAEILLIDEILAVGDQHFQEKCYNKLRELRDSNKTIVIVTHSLEVVKDLCTRVIWIYKGQLRLDGDPTYVVDEYLEQVAQDHKQERQKNIESGKQKVRLLFILIVLEIFQKWMQQINNTCLRDGKSQIQMMPQFISI